jgi:hypothetical protein
MFKQYLVAAGLALIILGMAFSIITIPNAWVFIFLGVISLVIGIYLLTAEMLPAWAHVAVWLGIFIAIIIAFISNSSGGPIVLDPVNPFFLLWLTK